MALQKTIYEKAHGLRNTLNEFIALINKPLNKIYESDIEYYLLSKKPNNTSISLNNLRRNLSAFFTWMRKEKIISENPCDAIEPYTIVEKPIDHMEATDVE